MCNLKDSLRSLCGEEKINNTIGAQLALAQVKKTLRMGVSAQERTDAITETVELLQPEVLTHAMRAYNATPELFSPLTPGIIKALNLLYANGYITSFSPGPENAFEIDMKLFSCKTSAEVEEFGSNIITSVKGKEHRERQQTLNYVVTQLEGMLLESYYNLGPFNDDCKYHDSLYSCLTDIDFNPAYSLDFLTLEDRTFTVVTPNSLLEENDATCFEDKLGAIAEGIPNVDIFTAQGIVRQVTEGLAWNLGGYILMTHRDNLSEDAVARVDAAMKILESDSFARTSAIRKTEEILSAKEMLAFFSGATDDNNLTDAVEGLSDFVTNCPAFGEDLRTKAITSLLSPALVELGAAGVMLPGLESLYARLLTALDTSGVMAFSDDGIAWVKQVFRTPVAIVLEPDDPF